MQKISPKPLKTQKTQTRAPEKLKIDENNAMLWYLTQENASKDTEERRNPSKFCSKNPENSMKVQNVLILINFIILNVVSQIGDGTGSTRSLFSLF